MGLPLHVRLPIYNVARMQHCRSRMQIGIDIIRGDPELCLMAIDLDQPIGHVVVRDAATGQFRSLTRLLDFGRRVIGPYLDVELIELESRPNPRRAPANAARLVIAVALVVVTTAAPAATLLARMGVAALLIGAQFGRWAVAYVQRELVAQWRVLAITLGPAVLFLAWVAIRIHRI